MKRIFSMLLTVVMIMRLLPGGEVFADPADGGNESHYATGLIWDSWDEIESKLRKEPALRSVLPPAVDLEDEFPAPGNQALQGSCVAWAVAYALKSHQEEVKRNWGLDTNNHLFSPSYVYNQINGGVDRGSSYINAFNLIVDQGVSTLESFPYRVLDYRTQPTTEQRAEAAYFRAKDWYSIYGIDSIKRRLADGDGVVVGVEVFSDLEDLDPSNPIYDTISGIGEGGHAICLIGYDDEKSAFKFINSWGTVWGLDGYGWISYDLMEDIRINRYGKAVGYVMEPYDDIIIEDFFEVGVSDGKAIIIGYRGTDNDIEIPNTFGGYEVTQIDKGAFQNNTSLTSVVIPDNVATIDSNVFSGCTSLSNVIIGSGVTEINYAAFSNCNMLTDFTVNEDNSNYTSIEGVLFDKNLTTLHICPAGKVGEYSIPDSVTTIGMYAFYGCASLTAVVIPNSVKAISRKVFSNCSMLTDLTVHEDNRNYTSIEGVLFNKNVTTLIAYPAGKAGEYTIPDSIKTIGREAFDSCALLTAVIIPNSVTTIGVNAFNCCTSITSIVIPNSVTTIRWYAFENCTSLTGVVIPDSVTTIGLRAFMGCTALTSIVIPGSVTTIDSMTFNNCTSLEDIVISDGVTAIDDMAFNNCAALTNVVIPDSVTTIGRYAFYGCASLTVVVIPNSVNVIGDMAFHDFSRLGSYPLPNLTIHCYENSYVHDYAIQNKFSFLILPKAETQIIEVSKLPNSGDIAVNHITLTKSVGDFYNLAVDFEKAGEVFFIVAVYEGDLLIKAYLAGDNAEIKNIAEQDLLKGKIYIWDKNMQACIKMATIPVLNQI